MKIAALLTVMALASGVAMAQPPAPVHKTGTHATTTNGETLGAKTRRAGHKSAAAIRHAGHKVAHATRRATHSNRHAATRDDDTRSMGATGTESSRRTRMDSAYDSWRQKRSS